METQMTKSMCPTRQMTPYHEDWPDNKAGCLFYVSQDNKEGLEGGIYLVDSPIRKGDQLGEHDLLHRDEWNQIKVQQPILVDPIGYTLYQCFLAPSAAWEPRWKYCMKPEKEPAGVQEILEYLFSLCRTWLNRDRRLLESYAGPQLMQFAENAMRLSMQDLLDGLQQSQARMMWSVKVKLPIDRKSGFIPDFLNYCIVGTILFELASKRDITTDDLAQLFLDYLSEEGEAFPLNQIVFDFIDYPALFKMYFENELEKLDRQERNNLGEAEFRTKDRSDLRKKRIIETELNHYAALSEFLDSLPPVQSYKMKDCANKALLYMINHVEEDPNRQRLQRKMNELFHQPGCSSKYALDKLLPIPNLPFPEISGRWCENVYEYIITRKKYDSWFADFCNSRGVKNVCDLLNKSFDCNVSDNSLGSWLRNHDKTISNFTK